MDDDTRGMLRIACRIEELVDHKSVRYDRNGVTDYRRILAIREMSLALAGGKSDPVSGVWHRTNISHRVRWSRQPAARESELVPQRPNESQTCYSTGRIQENSTVAMEDSNGVSDCGNRGMSQKYS